VERKTPVLTWRRAPIARPQALLQITGCNRPLRSLLPAQFGSEHGRYTLSSLLSTTDSDPQRGRAKAPKVIREWRGLYPSHGRRPRGTKDDAVKSNSSIPTGSSSSAGISKSSPPPQDRWLGHDR